MQQVTKENLTWFIGGAAVSGLIAVFYHRYVLKKKPRLNVLQYIFFTPQGKVLKLTDREINSILQQNEDGVLLSAIAAKFQISVVMVARIINFIQNL